MIGVVTQLRKVFIDTFGLTLEVDEEYWPQNYDLELVSIPMYAREDAVAMWCSTTVRQVVEYCEVVEFVSWGPIIRDGCSTKIWVLDQLVNGLGPTVPKL